MVYVRISIDIRYFGFTFILEFMSYVKKCAIKRLDCPSKGLLINVVIVDFLIN